MKTFSKIVKTRRSKMITDPNTEEGKWILQSLVNITLNYRISGNTGMFNHAMKTS